MASAAAHAAPSAGKPGRAEGVAFLPLTFTSDEKGLGQKVQQMLRFKAKRIGATVYDAPSIKEVLGSRKVSGDTTPAELAALGRRRFDAGIVLKKVRDAPPKAEEKPGRPPAAKAPKESR